MLKRWSAVEIVGVCPSVTEAVRRIARCTPDVLVFALSRHPKQDLQAVETVKALAPECKVVLIEEINGLWRDKSLIDWSVLPDIGVTGLIRGLWELCRTVQRPVQLSAAQSNDLATEADPRMFLTTREYEVLCALCEGLHNREIALRLGTTDKTVKNHLSNIYRKTNTGSRTQLVLWAMERGFLTPPDYPPRQKPQND